VGVALPRLPAARQRGRPAQPRREARVHRRRPGLAAGSRAGTDPDVTRHVAAICLWVLAWACAGLIPAGMFAARNGDVRMARRELAAGVIGAAGLALIGAWLW
jgi:hypothetical protein